VSTPTELQQCFGKNAMLRREGEAKSGWVDARDTLCYLPKRAEGPSARTADGLRGNQGCSLARRFCRRANL